MIVGVIFVTTSVTSCLGHGPAFAIHGVGMRTIERMLAWPRGALYLRDATRSCQPKLLPSITVTVDACKAASLLYTLWRVLGHTAKFAAPTGYLLAKCDTGLFPLDAK